MPSAHAPGRLAHPPAAVSTGATIVLAFLSGGVSGAIASLLAPWSQWGVEKRRLRLERRREIMEGARAWTADGLNRLRPVGTADTRFAGVRPYLSDELRKELAELGNSSLDPKPWVHQGHPFVRKVSDDLERLAKLWRL
jgi:hypothetical protein